MTVQAALDLYVRLWPLLLAAYVIAGIVFLYMMYKWRWKAKK